MGDKASDGPGPTNEPLAAAVRTLLAGGMLVDSAHRKPEYVAVSCHRVDDFGVPVPYLVVLGEEHVSPQAAAAGLVVAGEPTLVWGWSAETNSPYYPMWRTVTTSGVRYVTSTGSVLEDPEFQAPLAG